MRRFLAALATSLLVLAVAIPTAQAGQVEGKEDPEEAIAVGAERFGGQDSRDDAVGGRPGHGRYDPPAPPAPSRVAA